MLQPPAKNNLMPLVAKKVHLTPRPKGKQAMAGITWRELLNDCFEANGRSMTTRAVVAWFKENHPTRREEHVRKELNRRCTFNKDRQRWSWTGGWKKKKKKTGDVYAIMRQAIKNETKQGVVARHLLHKGREGCPMYIEEVRDVLRENDVNIWYLKRWLAPVWKSKEKLARGVFRLPHPFMLNIGCDMIKLHKKLYTFYKDDPRTAPACSLHMIPSTTTSTASVTTTLPLAAAHKTVE